METAAVEKATEGFSACRPGKHYQKVEWSFPIKASVTNKVTQQKQELTKSCIFHKTVLSFSASTQVTSREPCCADFSSERGRELQYFAFSATAASKSLLRTQRSALIALPHSWGWVEHGLPSRSYERSPSRSQRQICHMSDSGKLSSAVSIINFHFAP